MRTLFPFCLIALLPALTLEAQEVKEKKVEPIKVVKIDRKEPVTYEKDVEPILYRKCQFCHAGPVKEGRFDLGTYEAMMRGGRSGEKPIVPGKSAESFLVKVSGRTARPYMPPLKNAEHEPLTPEELALLKLWIDQGAKPPSGTRERPKVVLNLPPAAVKPVRAIAISPDKSSVASSRGNQLHIYDAGSGTYIRSLIDPNLITPDKKPAQAAHMSLVTALAFSPDGKLLVSGSFQEVIFWDAQTGALRTRIGGFAHDVVALAFSRDGKYLATGGGAPTEDGEIKLIDVAEAKVVQDIKNGHSDTVYGVCFSPDSKMLATCGADKFVKVFEVPGGKFVKSFEGHTHHVLDVGWKSDGKLLASAGADNTVKVWNFDTGEQARTINNAHSKQVTRLLFIGNTNQVITCSGDQTVKVFNVDNGGAVRNISGSKDFLYAVGVSSDGAVLAAGGEEGVVRLYNGANGNLLKELQPPGTDLPTPKK
jgi:WD40 repeat protein